MRKTVLFVLTVSMLLLSPAVFAQDKPAESGRSIPAAQPTAGRRFSEPLARGAGQAQGEVAERIHRGKGQAREQDATRTKRRCRGATQDRRARCARKCSWPRMTRLQEQHKTNVGELQAVKQIAVKENAKETADALTQLIAKHERQFNQQMQVLQRKMKLLQGDQDAKAGPAGQTPAGNHKPRGRRKSETKPQSAGTKR